MAIQKFGQAELAEIIELEEKYDMKLPDDYINFLRKYNGGLVSKDDKCGVYVRYLKNSIYVDAMYGINSGYRETDIKTWMEEYSDEMPAQSIIIGDSIEYGFIVLMCAGEDAGVYYWDHTWEFESSNEEANTYFIAKTFTEFAKNFI